MEENILINASFLPNEALAELVSNLEAGQAVVQGEEMIAFYTTQGQEEIDFETYELIEYTEACIQVENTWDLFQKNDAALREDFELLTQDRVSQPLPATVHALQPENIFIEEGAVLNFVTLNASTGPIYIGKNTGVMEQSRWKIPVCSFVA